MKKAALIVNFHSGMQKSRKILNGLFKIFEDYQYDVLLSETKYENHAMKIIEELPNDISLVVSVGGDGTFNEVVTGNLKREDRFVVSHIPYGTTNDIGAMFSMGKNIEKNLISILSGKVKKIDICMVNERPFVYVAGFGKFMNVPYETPRKMKKKLGYIAYVFEAIHDFFHVKTHLYDLTYEVDDKEYRGLYSFALISNANRIAGIRNFYKDVKLDDHKFEVLFCNLTTKKDIMRSLFGLRISDIAKIPGFYFYKTDYLKVTFHEKLRKPWCLDWEEYLCHDDTYVIQIIPDVELLLPIDVSKELFENE